MKPLHLAVLAGLLMMLPGNAAAQIHEDHLARMATASRSEPGPPRRGCGPVRSALPALSAIADSTSLMAAVADFAARYPVSGDSVPYALYSLTVDRDGELRPPRALAYLLPQGQADAFMAMLYEALGQGSPPSGSMRLRVRVSSTPTIRLEPSQRCPAELRSRLSLVGNALSAGQQRPRPARVRAVVAEDGRVLNVQILTSTGDPQLDRWIQDVLLRSGAVPGLVDGIPAQMEVDETIQIQTRG